MLSLGLGLNKNSYIIGNTCTSPAVLTNPTISGSLQVGDILTVSGGTFSGTAPLTYSYRWKRGATPIGTDSTTYVIVNADLEENITCEKTANNACGSATSISNAVVPEYNTLAADYFARVVANGDSSLTLIQKAELNKKFIALKNEGINNATVDRLFAYKYCYSEIQALTPWIWNGIGTGLATAVNSPTFTAGIGWTFTGTSYLRSGWTPSTGGNKFTLNNASIIWKAFGLVNATAYFISGIYDGANQIMVGHRGTMAGNFFYYRLNSKASSDTNAVSAWTNETKFKAFRTSTNDAGIEFDASTTNNNACASDVVPTIELYIGARNDVGDAIWIAQNGVGMEYFAIGDSTLNKDTIDTALAI